MMTRYEKAEFLTWMHDQGVFFDIQELSGDRYAAIFRFAFTWAILVGQMGDRLGYDDRWCFSSYEKAKSGLDAWDGVTGEPQGWHRHPLTGRRREMSETGEVCEHVWK